jgi:hypothetical protein
VPAAAHSLCSQCGTTTVVFPYALRSFIPEVAQPGLANALGNVKDDEGRRFAIADEQGHFNCPQCEADGYAPQIDLN